MPRISDSKYLIQAGWSDVPHLTEKAKKELLASTPPHLRAARSKGEPSMGAGAILPVDPIEFSIKPFEIPQHWPRAYGMDVGWNRTAVVWGGWDQADDTVYLYTGHYRGQAEASIHAQAIRARGEWIPGVIDPAARARSQKDGQQLMRLYLDLGLQITPAKNAVEAGLYMFWERLSTGRLKVFTTMQQWFDEQRSYHRDEKGQVVKEFDHYMDATRYLLMSGLDVACTKPSGKRIFTGESAADQRVNY